MSNISIADDDFTTWKQVPGYEGCYLASDKGDIYSIKYKKVLSSKPNCFGYVSIEAWKNRKKQYTSAHRLVAKTFLKNDDNLPEVNHIDFNRSNNNVKNLEWISRKENIRHNWENKDMKKSRDSAKKMMSILRSKIVFEKKVYNKKTGKEYPSLECAAKDIGQNVSTLSRRLRGLLKNETDLEYVK